VCSNKSNMATVTRPEIRQILNDLQQNTDPVCSYAAQCIEELQSLLEEALDCVYADEEASFESWPKEVERGELVLDLGDRIRKFLDEG
jgi:hypothetical protein